MKNPKIQIYKSNKNGQFGWRLFAKNSKKIACGGETYHNKKDCLKATEKVKDFFLSNSQALFLKIEDLTEKK